MIGFQYDIQAGVGLRKYFDRTHRQCLFGITY